MRDDAVKEFLVKAEADWALIEKLLSIINIGENSDFLEVGCGGGAVSMHMAETHHMNVTGVDLDSDMFNIAKKKSEKIPNICFLEADATNLPFEANKFDIVFSFGVLHHISNWQDVLKEINRILRKKGHFVLFDIVIPRFATKVFRRMAKKYGCYDINDMTDFLQRYDFEIIHKDIEKHGLMKGFSLVVEKRSNQTI